MAKLFIITEYEELLDNKDHAVLAHERATGVKKLVTIPDIKRYRVKRRPRPGAEGSHRVVR